jgi:hypothetical protein
MPGLVRLTAPSADEEGERRDDLEIDERLEADPPNLLDRSGAGDPDDEGREEQRRDDHLDQAQEDAAQDANPLDGLLLRVRMVDRESSGSQPPTTDAQREADEDLLGQGEMEFFMGPGSFGSSP